MIRSFHGQRRFSEYADKLKVVLSKGRDTYKRISALNNYAKTRTVYEQYRKAGYSKKLFKEHREEIQRHKAAKDAFNQLERKKRPTRKQLDEKFYQLVTEKKNAYAEYRQVKKEKQTIR